MSKESLGRPLPTPRVAWFGKLPGLGDFVGRRMPHAFSADWDSWQRAGLERMRQEMPERWVDCFIHAPLWFFATAPDVTGVSLCGAVAPSMDRVGRYYPIAIMAMATATEDCFFVDDAIFRQFLNGTQDVILEARRLALNAEDVDARLSSLVWPFTSKPVPKKDSVISDILGDLSNLAPAFAVQTIATLPQMDWRAMVSKGANTSVWWTASTQKFQEIVHQGALNQELFLRLFKGHR